MGRRQLARLGAPAAFLLAATVAVLLIRSALAVGDEPTPPPRQGATAPTPAEARPARKTPATPATAPATTAAAAEYYMIEEGDTLASVADQYGTTVEELLLLNPDVDPVSLTIGQRIRVQ